MGRPKGFTIIELLTVIAILIAVAAMALPNFMEMMRSEKWTTASAAIQGMVMRARALATNARTDIAVEFRVQDNGTSMWLESKQNDVERTPDLWALQHELGGESTLRFFITGIFYQSGGRYQGYTYEYICCDCGRRWSSAPGPNQKCPQCGNTGPWDHPITCRTYYYNFTYDSSLSSTSSFGHNAKQSEVMSIGGTMTINMAKSRNFLNWNSQSSVTAYGWDTTPDIRLGTNGALVQTQEPTIVIRDMNSGDLRAINVVRCTGRVKIARVP